jgi:Putative prokaryotic signal transducing protein
VDVNEPVVVYTTNNLAEAEILKNMLEGEGIKCELDGENQGSFAGVIDVRILVRAWDEERARQALASHGHHRRAHAGTDRRD